MLIPGSIRGALDSGVPAVATNRDNRLWFDDWSVSKIELFNHRPPAQHRLPQIEEDVSAHPARSAESILSSFPGIGRRVVLAEESPKPQI